MLSNLPIQVLYAGLAGTVLALVVATAQNKWSLKVFFLLALRLAIGWHFLFEGLHKINSHRIGVAENNRPFTSEPYFKDADGPLGPLVRARIGDVDTQLDERLTPVNLPDDFARLLPNARRQVEANRFSIEKLAEMAPTAVARDWQAFCDAFTEKFKLDESQKSQLKVYTPSVLAAYSRWVIGLEGRDSTIKFVSAGKPSLSAPQRLEYIEHRKKDVALLQEQMKQQLGTALGSMEGRNAARLKEAKSLVSSAKNALLADADAFMADLMKQAFDGTMNVRLEKVAASADAAVVPPSRFVDKDDKKLLDMLPAGKAEGANFDSLPPDVKHLWTNFQREFKAAYPLTGEQAKLADTEAEVAKVRFARWFMDKDEFTNADKPGLSPLVKTYRDTTARVAAAKPEVDRTLKAFEADEVTWFRKMSYEATNAIGTKLTTDAENARKALLAALDGKYAELRKAMTAAVPTELLDGKVMPSGGPKLIERMDLYTRWVLAAAGAMLLAGLFTRLACVVAAGFLVMTYLTHPPFPWLPLPPGTEGNPVFINKNVIEALGLMVILVHPTGRWMGLDAIIHRCWFGEPTVEAAPHDAPQPVPDRRA